MLALAFVCSIFWSLYFLFLLTRAIDLADHTQLFSPRQTLVSYRIVSYATINRTVITVNNLVNKIKIRSRQTNHKSGNKTAVFMYLRAD